ncbi:self-incompatibility protein S1-like [Solanum lycopersicum]|uniref:S-protein homolog n=1 Tax=Solanum lycopersicum TaxID=4081 RepID=A0A3Q7I978_SOLLC|nr:S-protein homolog 5-like [Solanum lycopersicum]
MALSFIKIFFLLLLITPNLDLSLAKKCSFFTPKYEIHVINKLRINNPQLRVHCASKDDEIADKYVAIDEDLHWSFCESFVLKTLYFCHFWWGPKNTSITVFDDITFCIHHGKYENLLRYCKWEVREDGFYLEQYNTTAGNKTYFMDHESDWS